MSRLITILLIITQVAYANECKTPQVTDKPCTGVLLPKPLALEGLNCVKTQGVSKARLQLDIEYSQEQTEICQVGAEETLAAFERSLQNNKHVFDKAMAVIEAKDKPVPWFATRRAFFWYGFASGIALAVGGAWATTQVKDAF